MLGNWFGKREGLKIAREEHFDLGRVPEGITDYEPIFTHTEELFRKAQQENDKSVAIKTIEDILSSFEATFFETGIGLRLTRLENAEKNLLFKNGEDIDQEKTTKDLSLIRDDIVKLKATDEYLIYDRLKGDMLAYVASLEKPVQEKPFDFKEAA